MQMYCVKCHECVTDLIDAGSICDKCDGFLQSAMNVAGVWRLNQEASIEEAAYRSTCE